MAENVVVQFLKTALRNVGQSIMFCNDANKFFYVVWVKSIFLFLNNCFWSVKLNLLQMSFQGKKICFY